MTYRPNQLKEFYPDLDLHPARSMEEYQERHKKAWGAGKLKNGEKTTFVLPAFDFHSDREHPDHKYGQHSATLVFAERRGALAISTEVFTGWTVSGMPTLMDGRDIGLMCTGTYFHYRYKKHAPEWGTKRECSFTGSGFCYGDLGSALYGEVLLYRLVNEGSFGIWDEFDKMFKEHEDDRKN